MKAPALLLFLAFAADPSPRRKVAYHDSSHGQWMASHVSSPYLSLKSDDENGRKVLLCDSRTGVIEPIPQCGPAAKVTCYGRGSSARSVFDGIASRPYCLNLPPNRSTSPSAAVPLPLLVYLHDVGGSVENIFTNTTLPQQAQSFALSPGLHGFALALPQARSLFWSAADGTTGAPAARSCMPRWDFYHRNFSTGRCTAPASAAPRNCVESAALEYCPGIFSPGALWGAGRLFFRVGKGY
eukprot:SAG11_NODE_4501_length_1873_cov_1.788032_2_plen_240_part_00